MTTQQLLAAQRRHLAAQLSLLAPADWERATLCDGWTVRHVVAHLIMPFRYSKPRMLVGIVRARGDFNRFADRAARRDAALPATELVAHLRDNADHQWRPPGAGFEGPLTDLVVHSLDITRPLGLSADIDPAALAIVVEHLVTPRSLEFFHLDLDGLALRVRPTSSGVTALGEKSWALLRTSSLRSPGAARGSTSPARESNN